MLEQLQGCVESAAETLLIMRNSKSRRDRGFGRAGGGSSQGGNPGFKKRGVCYDCGLPGTGPGMLPMAGPEPNLRNQNAMAAATLRLRPRLARGQHSGGYSWSRQDAYADMCHEYVRGALVGKMAHVIDDKDKNSMWLVEGLTYCVLL